MLNTRLIIVEGIMGSGKSTLRQAIARRFRQHRYPAKLIPAQSPHQCDDDLDPLSEDRDRTSPT
jgi:thymidylate kinase